MSGYNVFPHYILICFMVPSNGQNQDQVFLPPIIIGSPLPDGAVLKYVSKGDSITLSCNAEGYPKPNITWFRRDNYGTERPLDSIYLRDLQQFDNGSLEITHMQYWLEARYFCKARSQVGDMLLGEAMSIEVTLIIGEVVEPWPWETVTASPEPAHVDIESLPRFISDDAVDQSHVFQSKNVTEGETVQFYCEADPHTEPWPDVTLMINTQPLADDLYVTHAGWTRRVVSSMSDRPGKILTLYNVCIHCPGLYPDRMTIQCKLSNIHGYVLKNAYLNVLPATIAVPGIPNIEPNF